MLLAMIWSAGWAAVGDTYQKVTSESELSAGDIIVFASGSKNMAMADYNVSDYYNKVDVVVSEGMFDYVKGLSEFELGGQKGSWTFKNINDDSYLLGGTKKELSNSKSVGANNKASLTFEKDYVKVKFGTSDLYLCLNVQSKRFACYATSSRQTYTQIYKLAKKDSRKDSEIAFSSKSYEAKITDKDDAYHSYVNLNNPNNLSVTYASSKTDVAEVNAAGEVKVLGLGTTTISATFAGDDTYKNATVSYELTVVDPNVLITTFTSGVDKGSNGSSPTKGDVIIKNGVNISCSKTALGYDEDYRFYAGSSFTVSVSVGTITKIQFVGSGSDSKNSLANLKATGYKAADAKNGTWIGNAREVTFTADAQARATSITVYVSLPSEITLNETATNTIEAKTGVNVTLNRPMNVGRWNTFCVPFSIDANQVTSQFGEGTQIAEYSVSVDNEIAFATVQSKAIVAGKAYLVKPTKEAATEGYTFSNVNITALKPTKETAVDNGAIDFRGIYNPTDITVGLPTKTFAAGIVGNVVKKAVNGSNMKGFRAFFIIPEGDGAQSSYMLKIDGTATSINSINGADVVVNAPVYNLQGQRVDGNNLTPGIYVKAGKKFVVK